MWQPKGASTAFFVTCGSGLANIPRPKRERSSQISRQRDGGVGPTVALNRVLFEQTELSSDGDVTLAANDYRAAHVRNVLRLPRTGGTVRTGVLDSFLVDTVPVSIRNDSSVKFHVSNGTERELPKPPAVSLILAVPRPKVLARLLPQIAAVGVQNVVLCNAFKVSFTCKTVKSLFRIFFTAVSLTTNTSNGSSCHGLRWLR